MMLLNKSIIKFILRRKNIGLLIFNYLFDLTLIFIKPIGEYQFKNLLFLWLHF